MATLNDLNIFSAVPQYYEGLLGAQETEALRNRANTQGLLGAAIGLLGGMGTRGTSAAQNIAAGLAGGLQSSQGAVQQGITNFSQAQQLAQARLAQEQAKIGYEQAALVRQDIARVMQMPEVVSNPALVALLRSDPAKGLAWINENMAVMKAYEPQVAQPAPQSGVAAQPTFTGVIPEGKQLPPVDIEGKGSPLQKQKDRLLMANQRLTGLPGKTAQDAIKNNLDQITALDKQIMQESVSSFDFNSIRNTINPSLLPQVDSLQRLADTGQLSANELQSNLEKIQKADFEFKNNQRDYNKEAVRVAGSMFPDTPFNSLNNIQLGQLQTKLDTLDIAKRRAGATNVSVSTGKAFGSEFGKGVAESVNNTYSAAQGAQSTLSTIQNIRPLLKSGVYSGPLSNVPRVIDQLATSLGATGKDTNERLKNTAVAMQGLASIELDAAKNIKGQGAVTDFERDLIKRAAAGDLQSFTNAEILALLSGLEKTSQFKIKAHEKNLVRLRKRPDTADLADYYELEAPTPRLKFNPATGKVE